MKKNRFVVIMLVVTSMLFSLIAIPQAKPVSAAPGGKNPLGVLIVKFKGGVSKAEMNQAILNAGGEVVTDLSKIHSVAAVAVASDFVARISANPQVQKVFEDKFSVQISPTDAQNSGATGKNAPKLGNNSTGGFDPWHNLPSFLGEVNPEGILQWDDSRMNVPAAWSVTNGDFSVRVAVLDSGVQGSHKEILPNYDNQTSANMIPCNLLTRQYGPLGQKDCSSEDSSGHGTWVASRIAGALNGFASNGIAPHVQIVGIKVLSETLGGGLTSWIAAGMIYACDNNVDVINMSLGGFDDPVADADDYMLWVDAVNYCRSQGTVILASAGNDHVRINRVDMVVGGTMLYGVGQVDIGNEGYASVIPGSPLSDSDLRGLLETPAGVPGVVMVSATNNAIGNSAGSGAVNTWPAGFTGARDQLTYYSNYGSRIDITAPGGARKFNIPRYDGGNGDILYGGWGTFGALDPSGGICTGTAGSFLSFSCFKVNGAGFGFLQGTSMSSPNATGVVALMLSAHPELQGNPDGALARLQATARTNMVNYMVPNDPDNYSNSAFGVSCTTGYCHLDFSASAISFSDAYGAGMVNAGAAVAP